MAALAAGKHVYSEKPFATTLQDGQRILDLAAAKGLTVGNAPDTFLGGRWQTARKLVDSGVSARRSDAWRMSERMELSAQPKSRFLLPAGRWSAV